MGTVHYLPPQAGRPPRWGGLSARRTAALLDLPLSPLFSRI